MAEKLLVAGAGIAGLGVALAFGGTEHEVILLDRDPEPPEDSLEDAFHSWERRGATQLRHSHGFLGRLTVLLRDRHPALAALSERFAGLSAKRSLPRWRRPWSEQGEPAHPNDVASDFRDVILFGDTFNRAFERENLEAAERVLRAAGYRLHRVYPARGRRPLCCGRTWLASGQTDRARQEARRTLDTLLPFIRAGARVVRQPGSPS